MVEKSEKSGLVFILVFVVIFMSVFVSANSIIVIPSSTSLTPGQTLVVNISAATSTTNLHSIQYDFSYNSAVLSLVSVSEGPFLKTGVPPVVTIFDQGTQGTGVRTGIINARNTTYSNPLPLTGTGNITTLTFSVIGAGSSPLTVSNVIWINTSILNASAATVVPTITNSNVVSSVAGVCDLTSASWSTSSAVQGNIVQMIVAGAGDCTGKQINFTVWEYDPTFISPDDYMASVVATYDRGTWTAVYASEGGVDPDPEFYFDAFEVGNATNTIRSSDPKLGVSPAANTVYVSPAYNVITQGNSYAVQIKGTAPTGSSDIYAIQFDVTFNPSALSVSSITEGTFLNEGGSVDTIFNYSSISSGKIDNVYIVRNLTNGDPDAGLHTAEGVFATINFLASGYGLSGINISDVIWVNSTIDNDTAMTINPAIVNASVLVNSGIDNIPSVTLSSPQNSEILVQSIVNFAGFVSDDHGISNVSLYVDGIFAIVNISGTNNVNYLFSRTLSDGVHTAYYRACDSIGQCANSNQNTFTVDTSICGDALITGNEQCDGLNLNGASCLTLGYISGSLGCFAVGQANECLYNTSLCTGTPGNAPAISNLILSSTSGNNLTTDNLTLSYLSSDYSPGYYISNITDWRKNGVSIFRVNMPFDTNVSSLLNQVKDYSTYGNNGTRGGGNQANAPLWTQNGRVGGAYSFDGGDYIDLGQPSNMNGLSQITVMAWVNSAADNNGRIVSRHTGASYGWLLARTTGGGVEWRISTLGDDWDGPESGTGYIPINQWHHVVGTYDGSQMRVYVDGVLVSSAPLTGMINNAPYSIQIGADGYTGLTNAFNGRLDEITITNKSLSAEQIKKFYDETSVGRNAKTITSSETNLYEIWSASLTGTDGTNESQPVLSNNLQIISQATNNPPSVNLNAPIRDFVSSSSVVLFNASVSDDVAVKNVSLYLSGVLNETNISGINNANYLFTKTFASGNYGWMIRVCDTVNQCVDSESRVFIVEAYSDYDVSKDGFVNIADIQMAGSPLWFGSTCNALNTWCGGRDVNQNGFLNIQDLSLIGMHFT